MFLPGPYLLILAFTSLSIPEFYGAKATSKANKIPSFEYNFPYTYSLREFFQQLKITDRVEEASNVPLFRRLTLSQCFIAVIWDAIFGTNCLSTLLSPGRNPHARLENLPLSPQLYDAAVVSRAVGFCRLSFCRESRIKKGSYFRQSNEADQNPYIDVSKHLMESYVRLKSSKYSTNGYVMVYRDEQRDMKRHIVVAYHAARNDPNTEAIFSIGMHQYYSPSRQEPSHIYLGWHAAMVELLPQLKSIFTKILFECNGDSEQDPLSYLESIDEVLFTGPCMGGVFAELSALHIYTYISKEIRRRERSYENMSNTFDDMIIEELQRIQLLPRVYTFGAPRVGDDRFVHKYNSLLGNQTFRLVNQGDSKVLVPYNRMGFRHVGQEVFFEYARQTKGGEKYPVFEKRAELNEYGEDPSLGSSGNLFYAFLPFLHRHTFYFGADIMHCFRNATA